MLPYEKRNGSDRAESKGEYLLSALIADLVKTRETRNVLGDLVPEIMQSWAGESRLKRKIAGQTGGFLKKRLEAPGDVSLSALMENPEFMATLLRFLPEIMGGLTEALNAVFKTMETATHAERARFLSGIAEGISRSRLGEALTILIQTVNREYAENSAYLSDKLGPAIVSWLETLDVGELREFLDHVRDDGQVLIKMVTDLLWKYPSKLVLFLGFIADAVNLTTMTACEVINVFNRISPDLITDVAFSIFRNIEGESVGRLINEGAELIRKLHTGSALIGEPGTTQLPMDLTAFLEDVLKVLDGETLWKAKVAIAQEQEIISRVFYNVLSENPERLERRMIQWASIRNARLRSFTDRLTAIDRLPDDKVADTVDTSLKNLDWQEAADVVNLILILINKVRTLKPAIIADAASQLVESLDLDEIRESLSDWGEDLSDVTLPLERIFVPKLVTVMCRALAPQDDDYEDEAQEARDMLRSLLTGEEVTV
jgi:hypothetical protein